MGSLPRRTAATGRSAMRTKHSPPPNVVQRTLQQAGGCFCEAGADDLNLYGFG